jgi:N-carbamoylputrescine amidase
MNSRSVIPSMFDTITVAAVQMEPRIGEPERNRAHSLDLIEQAADCGARLIVLPELANSGYMFTSRAEAMALAEESTRGTTIGAWCKAAAARGLTIVAGFCERSGEMLYNSAIVIGAGGVIGLFRKVHLWDKENVVFTPGDLGFPVFDLPFGRMGVCICYDGWFPETYRVCALAAADLVAVPTNWVPMPEQPPGREVMANTLVMAGAHSNGLFVVAADRVGTERGQPFLGNSLIVGPTGFPLAGPASAEHEEILLATIAPRSTTNARRLNAHNHLLGNRRPEQYHS